MCYRQLWHRIHVEEIPLKETSLWVVHEYIQIRHPIAQDPKSKPHTGYSVSLPALPNTVSYSFRSPLSSATDFLTLFFIGSRMKIHFCTKAMFFLLLSFILLLPGEVEADPRVDGCQCTDFVYSQRPDIPLGMGHAKSWLYSARVHKLPYDQVPQVGDVAVILNGEFGFSAQFGHVAMVTNVSEERDSFGIAGWDGFKNDCQLQVFQDLPVTYNTYFIHRVIDGSIFLEPYTEGLPRFENRIDLEPLAF